MFKEVTFSDFEAMNPHHYIQFVDFPENWENVEKELSIPPDGIYYFYVVNLWGKTNEIRMWIKNHQ